MLDVDRLAQEIRRVDGGHSLGAGALAEALMPFLSAALAAMPQEPVAKRDPNDFRDAAASIVRMAHEWYAPTSIDPMPEGAIARRLARFASPVQGATAPSEEDDPSPDEIDAWLVANCGVGIPYEEANSREAMLHGLAYVLRQIEAAPGYRPNIGQILPATSALRMALRHFALITLRAERQRGKA